MLASLDAAVASEHDAGASKLAAKQVSTTHIHVWHCLQQQHSEHFSAGPFLNTSSGAVAQQQRLLLLLMLLLRSLTG
jgi:hypothetical protein